ncbi:MAG: ABC transporter substrate-binding protein [Defluviitaleaceae bacterium]|nr:ABC transporter substrate-binding protein [Defluviitaleaceae bacterium]
MKKFIIVTVCILCVFGLAACGRSEEEQTRIGILQMMEHPSLDTIRISFLEEMERLGYGDADFDHRNGQGADMTLLTSIAQAFVGRDVDLILAIATPAGQAAAATTRDIPVVFAASTDPVAAGLVTSLNRPDANVTGTSDVICVESIFALARKLTPEATTFGLVYNLGEANSVAAINRAKAYLTANGMNYLEATVTNSGEVQQAALSLVGRVDAFFTPTDNTVAASMPIYARVAIEAGLPIYTGADSMVMDGGFATVGIDYSILGIETARLVAKVLEGTPISELPVVVMQDFRTVVNRATAVELGISLEGLDPSIEIIEGR